MTGQHEVRCASGGYDGLVQIGAFQPHIIFLDVVMPDMDGLTLLDSLATICGPDNVRIIVVTGSRDRAVLASLDALAPDAIIRKPYLFEEIDRVLKSG
ncbi:MAG: response regulator [Gammaproteobacteria bacterium]|nr:response regulator [Gammaproteobacteria bacterium]